MKFILAILLLNVINGSSFDDAERMVEKALEMWDIEANVTIVDKPSAFPYSLIEYNTQEDIYFIFLDTNQSARDIRTSLCHELVHLKQYAEGRLTIDGHIFTFEGREYNYFVYPHSERPWEREANRMQRDVCRSLR
jgi:hypothetical protein